MSLVINAVVNSVQSNADGTYNISLNVSAPSGPVIHASMMLLLGATAKSFVGTLTPGDVISVTVG